MLVTELVERDALDQLHHEERRPIVGCAGVEQPGDMRVVHQRDRLPLRLESGQDRLRLTPINPDQLDCHLALDRLGLVGHPHRPHAPLADQLPQLVPSGNDGPYGFFGR